MGLLAAPSKARQAFSGVVGLLGSRRCGAPTSKPEALQSPFGSLILRTVRPGDPKKDPTRQRPERQSPDLRPILQEDVALALAGVRVAAPPWLN